MGGSWVEPIHPHKSSTHNRSLHLSLFPLPPQTYFIFFFKISHPFHSNLLDELPGCAAIRQFEDVGLEVAICEPKVIELFWVFFHLLQLQVYHFCEVVVLFEVLQVRVACMSVKNLIVFDFRVLCLGEEPD